MSHAARSPVLHPQLCDRCGKCVRACPSGLVTLSGGYPCIDLAACDGCLACGSVCGTGAIERGPDEISGQQKAPGKPVRSSPALIREAVADTGQHRGGWTLLDAGAVAAVLLAALLGKNALLNHEALGVMPPQGRLVAFILVLSAFYAVQLVLLRFLASRHGHTLLSAFGPVGGGSIGASMSAAGLVLALLVGTRAASMLWGAAAQEIGWQPPGEAGTFTDIFGSGTAGLVVAVLMAVIVAPVVEEMVFRGVVASALNDRFGEGPAIVLSAGMFSLYHVTPWLYVPMFILGAALAWLALRRRSLAPAILLHALYNGVVVSAAFWLAR